MKTWLISSPCPLAKTIPPSLRVRLTAWLKFFLIPVCFFAKQDSLRPEAESAGVGQDPLKGRVTENNQWRTRRKIKLNPDSSLTRLQRKLQHREMGRIWKRKPWLSEGQKSNSHQISILPSVNRTGILGIGNIGCSRWWQRLLKGGINNKSCVRQRQRKRPYLSIRACFPLVPFLWVGTFQFDPKGGWTGSLLSKSSLLSPIVRTLLFSSGWRLRCKIHLSNSPPLVNKFLDRQYSIERERLRGTPFPPKPSLLNPASRKNPFHACKQNDFEGRINIAFYYPVFLASKGICGYKENKKQLSHLWLSCVKHNYRERKKREIHCCFPGFLARFSWFWGRFQNDLL